MSRTFLVLAAGVALAGLTPAAHDKHGKTKVTTLSARDVVEKLDGKDARATMV